MLTSPNEVVVQATDPDLAKILVHIPGIALVILGFGLAFWATYWDFRRRQLEFEERRLLIERGMQPPPIEKRAPFFTHRRHLAFGIFHTSLGFPLLGTTAITGSSGAEYDAHIMAVGLAFAVFGLGEVLFSYLGKGAT